jgi:hypothetical protein
VDPAARYPGASLETALHAVFPHRLGFMLARCICFRTNVLHLAPYALALAGDPLNLIAMDVFDAGIMVRITASIRKPMPGYSK